MDFCLVFKQKFQLKRLSINFLMFFSAHYCYVMVKLGQQGGEDRRAEAGCKSFRSYIDSPSLILYPSILSALLPFSMLNHCVCDITIESNGKI